MPQQNMKVRYMLIGQPQGFAPYSHINCHGGLVATTKNESFYNTTFL